MDYELNKKYLLGTPISTSKPPLILILGIVFFVCSSYVFFIAEIYIYNSGIAFIILPFAGIVLTVIGAKNMKPPVYISDEQYDINVKRNLFALRSQAINALGIDESEVQEIAPIEFDGYAYTGAQKIKQGKDGRFRSNKYQSVIILFSVNEAHVYKYTYDTTCDKHSEETDVYFYKDIVSVSTSTDIIEVLGKKIESEYFKLTTAGGNALSVSVFDIDGAQRSINAMRALLREKKQQ